MVAAVTANPQAAGMVVVMRVASSGCRIWDKKPYRHQECCRSWCRTCLSPRQTLHEPNQFYSTFAGLCPCHCHMLVGVECHVPQRDTLSGKQSPTSRLSQALPQLVGLVGIPASFCCGWCSAAITKHHALVVKVYIPNKGPVMCRKRIKCPVVRIPRHGEQG